MEEIVAKLLKRYQTSERNNARRYVQTAKRQDRDLALKSLAKVELLQEIQREHEEKLEKLKNKD